MFVRVHAAALALAVVLSGCGGGVDQLAKETCAELEGAIVLQAGPIVQRAIADAEDMGATAGDLGDAMRSECPEIMAAIENIGQEQEQRDALPGQMDVEVTACTIGDGAEGTVKNNSASTVDVFIDVQYLDQAGTVVDDGIGSISGLRAGETGRWQASSFEGGWSRCRANVGNVFEQ
jgi:hypothetical protein